AHVLAGSGGLRHFGFDPGLDPAPRDGPVPVPDGREGGGVRGGLREESARLSMRRILAGAALVWLAGSRGARAQAVTPDLLRGGVPTGAATEDPLALTLDQAIERGLEHNLGSIVSRERIRLAEGEQREARVDLLPHLRAGASAVRQKISLAAFGFSGFGDFPELIGPFNVVDARAYLSQTVLDLHAIHHEHSQGLATEAARQQLRNTRDSVVLACAGLYLQALAGESRIAAVRAQLATAQALFEIASDRKKSG